MANLLLFRDGELKSTTARAALAVVAAAAARGALGTLRYTTILHSLRCPILTLD